jgi:anti-sigma factor ChrR (cupin superfamily)
MFRLEEVRNLGCELIFLQETGSVRGLLLDRQTGLVTALMRLAPGAILPDHEHVKTEQTYMLQGKLVDEEGPVGGAKCRSP